MPAELSTRELMDQLVEFHRALQDHERRHGIAWAIEQAMSDVAPEAPIPEPVLSPQDSQGLDLAIIGLEFSETAQSTGIADPGRFAEFLADAADHGPDAAFMTAATVFTEAHLVLVKNALREGSEISWNDSWRLTQLGVAAERLGGPLTDLGDDLQTLAGHINDGTARARLLAQSVGLFNEPGEHPYLSLHSNRDTTPTYLRNDWAQAILAVDACADTSAGRALRTELLERAGAFVAWGARDLEELIQEQPGLYHGDETGLLEMRAIYLEAMDRIAERGPGFGPDTLQR